MNKDSQRYSTQEVSNLELGQCGWDVISDTNNYLGLWVKIIFLSDTTFTTLTDENSTGDPTAVSYPSGKEITGRFTAITLASGAVHAVRGV